MNKRLKKFFITIIIIFISISILLGIVWLVVPIRRSDNAIRKYILKKIELGTNYTDVINYINNENWEIRSENSYGMSFNEITGEIHSIFKDDEKKSEIKILGEKTIYVYLGEYYVPLATAVKVYFIFDENDKLIEVGVNKEMDGL